MGGGPIPGGNRMAEGGGAAIGLSPSGPCPPGRIDMFGGGIDIETPTTKYIIILQITSIYLVR